MALGLLGGDERLRLVHIALLRKQMRGVAVRGCIESLELVSVRNRLPRGHGDGRARRVSSRGHGVDMDVDMDVDEGVGAHSNGTCTSEEKILAW